jgi:hypothetical protein
MLCYPLSEEVSDIFSELYPESLSDAEQVSESSAKSESSEDSSLPLLARDFCLSRT